MTVDETLFYDSFEPDSPHVWQQTGFWHIHANPETLSVLSPTVSPNMVTLPDAGRLPAAPHGNHVAWYGDIAPRAGGLPTNTFLGEYDPDQEFKSGGKSLSDNNGDLISPPISLPALPVGDRLLLQFSSWWEVESVDIHEYDLMQVWISADGGSTWTQAHRLNPVTDVDGSHYIGYTSGGFFKSGVWQAKTVDLSAYEDQTVLLKFSFQTRDELFNGFRGWLIDEVKVRLLAPYPAPLITAVAPNPASAGAEVHIEGANFFANSRVVVGGVVAESTTHSDSLIAFLVPSIDVGDYMLQVENPDGQWAEAPFSVSEPATIAVAPIEYETTLMTDTTKTLDDLVISNDGASDLFYRIATVDAAIDAVAAGKRRGRVSAASVSWLDVAPDSATVQPGESVSHTVSVNTADMAVGSYQANILIDHNDPDTSDPLLISVTLHVVNTPPVADAGPDQKVVVGAIVQLDGSGSTDADGNPLAYKWEIVSKPDGSVAAISDDSVADPTLTVDAYGVYLVLNSKWAQQESSMRSHRAFLSFPQAFSRKRVGTTCM